MKNSSDYLILSEKFYLFAIILLFCVFKVTSQNSSDMDSIRNNPYSYPFLWDMIESYFYLHYKLPETAKELIFDIERIENYKYNQQIDSIVKMVVIPKIKANESSIKFLQKDSIFYVQINDSTYEGKGLSNYPCKYISQYELAPYEPGYPFLKENILYFDTNNHAIMNDSIVERLNSQFKDIKFIAPKSGIEKGFVFFKFNKTKYPCRIFLEYDMNKGLHNFCTKGKIPDNEYYNRQAELLKEFCLKNKLIKIIWFGFEHKEVSCT